MAISLLPDFVFELKYWLFLHCNPAGLQTRSTLLAFLAFSQVFRLRLKLNHQVSWLLSLLTHPEYLRTCHLPYLCELIPYGIYAYILLDLFPWRILTNTGYNKYSLEEQVRAIKWKEHMIYCKGSYLENQTVRLI